MVIWVKKEATGRPNNQRARIDRIEGQKIFVTMLGDDAPAIIFANEICGVELDDSLDIRFDVIGFSFTIHT